MSEAKNGEQNRGTKSCILRIMSYHFGDRQSPLPGTTDLLQEYLRPTSGRKDHGTICTIRIFLISRYTKLEDLLIVMKIFKACGPEPGVGCSIQR